MADKIYPWDDAEAELESAGIDFDDIPEDKLTQSQLNLIMKGTGRHPEVRAAAYQTIKRLNDSAKKKATKNDTSQKEAKTTYAWEANVKNSMVGTQASINAQEDAIKNGDRLIEWQPSRAEEQDIQHALFYGKILTLDEAVNVHELGTRYGCKCGYEFVD